MNREPHGGLRLPQVSGIGAAKEGEIHKRWAYSEEITSYMTETLGITPISEPQYLCPTLDPDKLNTPDSKEYTNQYRKFMAWHEYLTERLSEHKALMLELNAEMNDIEVTIRTSLRKNSKRLTKAGEAKPPSSIEMEDEIHQNPRYVELKQLHLYESEVLERLGTKVDGLWRNLQLISRQVEIRRQGFDGNNRSTNIAGRGGIPAVGRTPATRT